MLVKVGANCKSLKTCLMYVSLTWQIGYVSVYAIKWYYNVL